MFSIPNSFGELHDARWLQRKKYYYQNPTQYKKHLKEEADQHWDLAKKGGISDEMSEHEAIRKRKVEDEERKRKEKEDKRKKEQEALGRQPEARGAEPNFPKVWDLNYFREDTQKIFKKLSNDEIDWSFFDFHIYPHEQSYFTSDFYENLDELKWSNPDKVKDIRKTKFDIKQKFFNAVATMYVITWKSGFSLENINYKGNSNVLTSLCKFHLYFWFKRFQKQPELLEKHLKREDYKFLMNELKLYNTYTDKFDHTKRIWGYQVRDLNEKYGHGGWRNLRVHNSRYGGQIGYSYQIINETLPLKPEKQFIRFIRPTSVGLNSLGQTFLIQSIEAFCYCILGAQSDTRFPIVNQGAKSMQTQAVFRQLVNSSIVQNDNTIMLNNFRTAVKDTNVILNQNVSPGLLIIPSSLIILEHPIPGYNNYLTTSSADMRFGTNTGLNKTTGNSVPDATLSSSAGVEKKSKGSADSTPSKHNEGSEASPSLIPRKYSYHGGLLGATGNEKNKSDEARSTNNKIFWGIAVALSGLVVFEIVISRDGLSFRGRSKS